MALQKKRMTVEEAGRLGGEKRARLYSKQELKDQAKQAARTIEARDPGFHARIGKKGGERRAEEYSDEELSEQAKRAARTVEERHPGFHSEIGKKGGEARVQQRQEEAKGQEEDENQDRGQEL